MRKLATSAKFSPIQRFRRLLKLDQRDITHVYFYALFNGLVALTLPLGIQAIINLIQGGMITTSWMVLVGFVIAGVFFTGLLQMMQLRIVEHIAQKIFTRATFEFAYRIPRIKSSSLKGNYAPELTNRFFDTMTIQKSLPKILIDFTSALFQIVVGLVLLSFYHSFFILFGFFLVGLIYLIIAITGPRGLKTSLKESSFKYKVAFWLEEIARTRISFKLNPTTDIHLSKSDALVGNYLKARQKHFKILMNQYAFLIFFKVLIAAGLLLIGGVLVFQEQMNIGQFVAAEIIIILILASVEKLIKSLDSIYDVLTALEKIGLVTDLPLESEEGIELDHKDGYNIKLQDVSLTFEDAAFPTFSKINFYVNAGQHMLIKGGSGSGKSSLLKIITGIIEPNQGLVLVNDFPLNSVKLSQLREHLGIIMNSCELFSGTILENIVMGRDDIKPEMVKKAIKVTGLQSFLSTIPEGLQKEIDPEGSRLPGNILDRILLARAIVSDPVLLILEDPLKRVDSKSKKEIIERLCSKQHSWNLIVASVDPVWEKYVNDVFDLDKNNNPDYVEYKSI